MRSKWNPYLFYRNTYAGGSWSDDFRTSMPRQSNPALAFFHPERHILHNVSNRLQKWVRYPPSTASIWPVMYEAAKGARKTTAPAISWG